jgi:hypothetical protein
LRLRSFVQCNKSIVTNDRPEFKAPGRYPAHVSYAPGVARREDGSQAALAAVRQARL